MAEQKKEEFFFPQPPRDWRQSEEWERYWVNILSTPFQRRDFASGLFALGSERLLNLMREYGFHRMLFAGNGISLEPLLFAKCGFDVTALDISHSACRYLETFQPGPEHFVYFLSDFDRPHGEAGIRVFNPGKSKIRVEKEFRPGGQLTVITADFFKYEPEEPYDVIDSRCAFQGFIPEDQLILARYFFEWLRPGGMCVVKTNNLIMKGLHTEVEAAFLQAGFRCVDNSPRMFIDKPLTLSLYAITGLLWWGSGHRTWKRKSREEAWRQWREEQETTTRKQIEAGVRLVQFSHNSI